MKKHFQNQLIDSSKSLCIILGKPPLQWSLQSTWRARKPLNSKDFQSSRLPFDKCATLFSTCLHQCSCVFGSIKFAILLGESKKTNMVIWNDFFIINALLGFIKFHNHFPPAIFPSISPTQDPTLNSLAGGWWWCLPGAIDQRVRWNSVSWSIFEGEKPLTPHRLEPQPSKNSWLVWVNVGGTFRFKNDNKIHWEVGNQNDCRRLWTWNHPKFP